MKDISIKFMVGIVVSMFLMSGTMMVPSVLGTQEGKNTDDLPDLAVRNIAWMSPVIAGYDLPVTIYIENIGNTPVQIGFWIDVNYASQSGFWQIGTETHQIWVAPPINEGICKAVEFTTTALNTEQANFEVLLDTTNTIEELNENNNIKQRCSVAIGVAPGTSFTTPVYLRNERLDITDIFTVEVNTATLPEGWTFLGGVPPTTIEAAPGGNVVLSETVIVPEDNIKNAKIIINASRQSDGELKFLEIFVITSPEIGIYFTPYTNEFIVSGSSYLASNIEVTSTIISEKGNKKVTNYTVTDDSGHYITATIETLSTRNNFIYQILELNNNGIVTILENNRFKITFLIDQYNELKYLHQEMIYEKSILYSYIDYNSIKDQTIMIGESAIGPHNLEFNGIASLSVRTWNNNIIPMRLDTEDYETWAIGIPGFCCWIDCPLLMSC